MTIVCSYCKKEIGEKCPSCGSGKFVVQLLAYTTPDGSIPLYIEHTKPDGTKEFTAANVCTCLSPACKATFVAGWGNVSHGICPACLEKESERPQA